MSLLAFAMAMLADPIRDPCLDDDHNNRCSGAKQAEMRALYRVPPIEAYAGASVRRIFFVDGYANDMVAIEFVRAAENDPVVRVHFPKRGDDPIAPMERALTASEWEQVIDASEHFDRRFAPTVAAKPEAENTPGKVAADDAIVMCLHSWVYWAEAIDSGEKPRSTVNDACNDEPVEQFAWTAARIAVAAIPYCDRLERKYHRNEAKLLSSCTVLSGDRLAAADAFNSLEGFGSIDEPSTGIYRFAAWQLTLDWNGEISKGKDAREFWQKKLTQNGKLFLYVHDVRGLDTVNVRVTGELVHHPKGNEPWSKSTAARIELALKLDGSDYDITTISVGPFELLPPPTE